MSESQPGQRLRVIRYGVFSGVGPSLVNALGTRVHVEDFDTMSYRRNPTVMSGRLLSLVERARTRGIPVTKTASWSSHVQKTLARDRLLGTEHPTLFVQSILALDPPPGLHYAIYTDQVGREGSAASQAYRSRFTQGWRQREGRFLRGAAIIFTMGPSTKAALTQLYDIDPARVSVVGAGSNAPQAPQRHSTQFKRFIFVGGDWDRKGGPELLKAFAAAREMMNDLQLLVVGHDPDNHLPDGVMFAGRLSHEDLSLAYSGSSAMVMPTHMEPFGIAIVEALLRGLPYVGTTVGNQEWLVGDAGVLVPPADTNALAKALVAVASDFPRFQSAAARRKHILKEVMQWHLIADKILAGLMGDAPPTDLTLV